MEEITVGTTSLSPEMFERLRLRAEAHSLLVARRKSGLHVTPGRRGSGPYVATSRPETEPHLLITGRRGSGHGYEMKLKLMQAQKVMKDFLPRDF